MTQNCVSQNYGYQALFYSHFLKLFGKDRQNWTRHEHFIITGDFNINFDNLDSPATQRLKELCSRNVDWNRGCRGKPRRLGIRWIWSCAKLLKSINIINKQLSDHRLLVLDLIYPTGKSAKRAVPSRNL